MVPVEEPGGVEEEWEGSLSLGVVLEEVLREDLLDGVGVLGVEAAVSHGAGAAPDTNGGHYLPRNCGLFWTKITLTSS